MAKITITLPDATDSWLTLHCKKNGYKKSTYLAFLCERQQQEKESIGSTGPSTDESKFTVGEVFKGTGKEVEVKMGLAKPELDDFGQPVKTMAETLKNAQKTLATPKKKRELCQHGIMTTGNCWKCREDRG